MKKITNQYVALLFAAATVFSVGCDDNDEIAVDPNADYDVVLDVKEGTANTNSDITVNAATQKDFKAKVTFSSTNVSMKRLYITENIQGQGETIYEPIEAIDDKPDGSVDVEKKGGKSFEYAFTLPVKSGQNSGTVVYKFWATSGVGDFRDETKRLAVGPGTITVKYGTTTTNPDAKLRTYSAKILAAPTADGKSSSFISLADGKIYTINQGAEFVAFWDFGYFYTTNGMASLASTKAYEQVFTKDGKAVVPISTIAGVTNADLNAAFFAKSTKTVAEFNAATKVSDFTFAKPANESVTNLAVDNILEFQDAYGNKGLIRVVEIKGTFNQNDYIKLDIKVQP